jgi:hypothetical protein
LDLQDVLYEGSVVRCALSGAATKERLGARNTGPFRVVEQAPLLLVTRNPPFGQSILKMIGRLNGDISLIYLIYLN